MASLTPELLAQIENFAKAATPGPWQWFGNTKMGEVYLATVHDGRTFIMDFVRWGMAGAQPRFRCHRDTFGIMRSLSELAKDDEIEGPVFEVPHRRDFTGIGHPDAAHIAAASPDVVLALVAAAKERDRLEEDCGKVIDERDAFHDRIDTIADALGDETEWSNCNDRGARALELASEIVKERDELRRSMEGSSLGAMRREVAQLRDMLAAAKAEIADIRRALDAHGHDGAFEAAAKQRAEVVQLRATIARLRKHVEKSTIINEDELEEIINAE